jgi:hypothetical protein
LSFYLIAYAKAAAAVVRKAAHQSSKQVRRGEVFREEDRASEDWEASQLVGSSKGRGGRGGRGGKGAGGGGSSSSSSGSGSGKVIPFAKKEEVDKAMDSLITPTTKGIATAHEVEDVPVSNPTADASNKGDNSCPAEISLTPATGQDEVASSTVGDLRHSKPADSTFATTEHEEVIFEDDIVLEDQENESFQTLPPQKSSRLDLRKQVIDRDWAKFGSAWRESLKRKFPAGKKAVPFKLNRTNKDSSIVIGELNWGSFMSCFNE